MKQKWNDDTLDQTLSATVKRSSDEFDQRAEQMLSSLYPEDSPKLGFNNRPLVIFSGLAAAAALTLFLTVTFQQNMRDEAPLEVGSDLVFETLIEMDDALKPGVGLLTENNFEAIESISWMIENS